MSEQSDQQKDGAFVLSEKAIKKAIKRREVRLEKKKQREAIAAKKQINILIELGYDPRNEHGEREQFFLETVLPQPFSSPQKTIDALKLLISEARSLKGGSQLIVQRIQADLHQIERIYRSGLWGAHIALQEERDRIEIAKEATKATKRKKRKKQKKRKHIIDRPPKGSVRLWTGRK